MLKAVIFDLDGVIVDSEPAYQEIEREMFAYAGIVITEEEHMQYIGRSEKEMWPILINKYKLQVEADEIINLIRKKIFDCVNHNNKIPLVEGIVELLKDLHQKDIVLAVASSSNRRYVHEVIKRYNLYDYFKLVVTGDDVKNTKPSPDIFLKVMESLCLKPDQCLVIEDSNNGVSAALKAGIKVIGYKNHNSGNQDISIATMVVNSLGELNLKKIENLFP